MYLSYNIVTKLFRVLHVCVCARVRARVGFFFYARARVRIFLVSVFFVVCMV